MTKIKLATIIMAGISIIVIILCAAEIALPFRGNTYSAKEDLLAGWKDENGKTVSLYQSFKNNEIYHTFSYDINGNNINGRSLCMISHNTTFTVWLEGELIYDYQPELGGIYGERYGEAVHTVNLPTYSDTRRIYIIAKSLRQDGTSGFNEAYLEDSRDFIRDLAEAHGIKLGFCIITFCFGFILFVIGIIEDQLSGKMIEGICLGCVTMIVSAWIGSQTMLIRLLSPNPALLRFLEYISLDTIPIPTLVFIAHYTKNTKSKIVFVHILLSALNTVTSVVFVLMNICDYNDMLPVTHLMIFLGVGVIIFLISKAVIRHDISRRKGIYIISAVSVLIFSGALDMLRYYIRKNANTAFLTVIGLLIFTIILAAYEYRRIIDMQVRATKTELMQTIAMKDALTGLGSRAAFVAYEKEILSRKEGCCIFVHFDVNNLKQVNDVHGHAEGDRHLIATANVLRESFGSFGKLYRVGGDEFFAILDEETCHPDYTSATSRLIRAQNLYNSTAKPPVPLAIAYGMAEYDYSTQNPEIAERLADSRMYEEKRRMKQAAAIAEA